MRPDMYDKFKERARKSLRSLGREVSLAAERGLDNEDAKGAPKP